MNPDLQPQITQMNTDDPAAEKHLRSSVPSAAKEEISCRNERRLRRRFYENFNMHVQNFIEKSIPCMESLAFPRRFGERSVSK